MTREDSAPYLICFRRTPDNWLEVPPLASSLQTLETAFMLIMLGRFPSALISWVSATESVLKAAFKIKQSDIVDLKNLVLRACENSQEISLRKKDFDKLRHARNRMIHYGISPRDDAESARYLLFTGINFISLCYKQFFGYDLIDGLLYWIADPIKVAIETFNKTSRLNIDHSYCFIPLFSSFRIYMQPTFKPEWEYDALEKCENNGIAYEHIANKAKEIESKFIDSWKFWCPVCNDSHLIAEIDGSSLDGRVIRLNRVVCCKCDLVIPSGCPELANVLLREEIAKEREAILKDYGLI